MEQTKRRFGTGHKFGVERVHEFEDGSVSFNLVVDGIVTIYRCRICEGKEGKPFVAFPSRKDKDGRYWNHAYIKLDAAQTEDIVRLVEEQLA